MLTSGTDITDEEIPEGWRDLFISNRDAINRILSRAHSKGTYYPQRSNVFRCFWECPLDKVRVVIVGQDPYKNPNHASGMSFSLNPGFKPTQSLLNIYGCIEKSYTSFVRPNHGDLRAWCKQGVLLLNTCLFYFPDNPISGTQRKFCMPFITRVINEVYVKNPDVVFVLWGNEASAISVPGNAKCLKGVHPSSMNGTRFIAEVTHFKDINDIISPPIDWTL